MSDSDLKDIFNAAAGTPNPSESLKNDQKDIKDIFKQAHDSPSVEELQTQPAQPFTPQQPHTLGSQIGNLIANGSSFPGISIAGHKITSPIGMAAKFLGNKFDEARTQDEKDNADRSSLNQQYQDQPWNNPGTQHDAQMAMGAGSGALNPALEAATGTLLNTAIPAVKAGVMNIGKLLNPDAAALGESGVSLFGKGVQQSVNTANEQLANDIVSSIKSEKGKIGTAYNKILDANQDKSIDLNSFVNNLKQRASEFDDSLPEQARDKKAIMNLIQKVTEGPETKQVIGYEPGSVNNTNQIIGFQPSGPTKTIPASQGAQDELIESGKKFVESQKQLGRQSSFNIVPSDDNNFLTLVTRTEGESGPIAQSKTITNNPGTEETPFSTPIQSITENTPTSQNINPITGMVRSGGTLTPGVPDAKTLRSNLGTLAFEKNLTNAGQNFGQATYQDLTQTLKDQIPGLAPTDEKFTELLNVARKLGIQGNDEDVVRVLAKMTSDNQGKQIIVKQALNSLDKVNPQLADQIRNQSMDLNKRVDLIDQISNLGDFDILNPKSLVTGLIKNVGAARVAGANAIGLGIGKTISTPIGQITQQAIPQVAKVTNPWQTPIPQSQGKKESDPGYITRTLSNATPESLQNIADKFQQDPTLKFCGEMLSKAVADNDSGAKDRAIFCAAQIPKARALLGSK